MRRIAIVAALEREVAALVRTWKVRPVVHQGRRYPIFENGNASLICGGIGADAARRATEAIIAEAKPERVLSVGFAGALDPAMKVGDIFEPRTVINAGDGVRTDTGCGLGTLVTFSAVAGCEQKEKLRQAYGASAVDMEAAAVAQGAERRGVTFGALKAVSDAAGFAMPPVQGFVDAEGRFRTVPFALHVAVRPWLWVSTIALARNGARASKTLCAAVEEYLSRKKL